jgi:hypothetical protein
MKFTKEERKNLSCPSVKTFQKQQTVAEEKDNNLKDSI